MVNPGRGSFRDRLSLLQNIMNLKLEIIRKSHKHSGNRGENAEQIVREFLREFLSPYNRIGHGEVIDLNGCLSRETDVIVTNEYHPFLNDLANPSVFIIEGVACAGEVKSVLTTERLLSTLEGARVFKSLSIQHQKGSMIVANEEDRERFVNRRPYFLFAFESELLIETVKGKIDAWNTANAVPLGQQLDAVFMLSQGNLINFGEGKGALQFVPPDGNPLGGYIHAVSSSDALVSFLSWLSVSMIRISMPHSPLALYLVQTST